MILSISINIEVFFFFLCW